MGMKKPVKPVKPPDRVYARGQNPASIATRIRGGKPPPKPPKPPKPDPGPEPPEDPEWKEMTDTLRDLCWTATYDDRWDTTYPRYWMRKWQRDKPKQFWKAFFKWHYDWERKRRR